MKKITFLFIVFLIGYSASAQVTATQPDPIILCDVNNPGDQMEVFDMTIREDQIIGGQSNVVVTYHPTSGDALGNGAEIPNPTNFTNEFNPHIIFIRVENINNASDWEVTTLELIVPLIPEVVEQPDDIVIAEDNSDGFAQFDLTQNEGQALGDADPFVFDFLYFETLADANANLNPIATPESYTNLTNPQTIYVRMSPLQEGCQFEIYDFEIRVEDPLGINELTISDFDIFPNPAATRVELKFSDQFETGTLEVFDVLGKRVFSEVLNDTRGNSELNIERLVAGIYLVKISVGDLSTVKKLIKR